MATDQVWLTHRMHAIEQLDYVQPKSTDMSVPSNSGGEKMLAVRNALDSDKEAVWTLPNSVQLATLQAECAWRKQTRNTASLM